MKFSEAKKIDVLAMTIDEFEETLVNGMIGTSYEDTPLKISCNNEGITVVRLASDENESDEKLYFEDVAGYLAYELGVNDVTKFDYDTKTSEIYVFCKL